MIGQTGRRADGQVIGGETRLPVCPLPRRVARWSALASAVLCLTTEASAQRRIILFIGDGVGTAHWTAARFAAPESLNISKFRVSGLVDTRSSNSLITDSGAGATAYSIGLRTYNYAIGVGPDSLPVETVLEAAKKKGWATGLVATSSITHATPASFASHVKSRASEFDIAKQMTVLGPDVMLGAGTRFFSPATRPDREDLIGQLRATHTVITDAAALAATDTSIRRLVGLFADIEMPRASQRSPTLPVMTRKAIEILSRDPDGFFLMVEGSQPDWRAHDNDPINAVIDEMLDFDAAIGVALEYQRRTPDALIVVVADHETGGLALELATDSAVMVNAANSLNAAVNALEPVIDRLTRQAADSADSAAYRMLITAARLRANARGARTERLFADYTTSGHTGQMVPLFAAGNGAAAFGGMIDNYRVGQMLLEIVRRPAPPTRRRRE
jgi:alkaline phosphatase